MKHYEVITNSRMSSNDIYKLLENQLSITKNNSSINIISSIADAMMNKDDKVFNMEDIDEIKVYLIKTYGIFINIDSETVVNSFSDGGGIIYIEDKRSKPNYTIEILLKVYSIIIRDYNLEAQMIRIGI